MSEADASWVTCPACNSPASRSAERCHGMADRAIEATRTEEGWHPERVHRGKQLVADAAWLRGRARLWESVPTIAMAMRQAAEDMLTRYIP